MKGKVLVIDDDEAIRKSLRMVLEYEGYEYAEAASGPGGIAALERESPDAVLLDIKMPGMDGLEALQLARKRDPHTPILMISGHGDVPTAVEAIRKGAYDFLEKPLESDRVLTAIRNAIEHKRLRQENQKLRGEAEERLRMVGRSSALKRIEEAVARAAPTHATVLITGESGTGKELIAQAIHRGSQRAAQPLVKVNCAAIPEELIESELFGHEKGAFTGAAGRQIGKFVQADGGTIFLDEIGDMSRRTQAKVLRVLESGDVEPIGMAKTLRVDVRVIAATNKDLPLEIQEGRFREDLFFRLNVVPITCPPLRERREDIPLLVEHFIGVFCAENDEPPRRFEDGALARLKGRLWRGNVRELKNAVERLLIMTPGETIGERDVASFEGGPGELPDTPDAATTGGGIDPGRYRTLQEFRDGAERAFITCKLYEFRWNVARTAKEIDTPRSNLYKKLEQYGISREGNRE
ncbi:MAG: sigma-54 dependent transcriptional regulator [Acidobacteria bacterium]|nr:sigma-54 dependent transcriptional regulator [Acidobacteriota bacterium]